MKRNFVRIVTSAAALVVVCAAAMGVMLRNIKKYEEGLTQIRLSVLLPEGA